jgi:hypothetical protein
VLRLVLLLLLVSTVAQSAERFVLVPQKTWLFRAPRNEARAVQLVDTDGGVSMWTFRYVRDVGAFVEVDGNVTREELCAPSIPGLAGLHLKLFVRRADLPLATVRPVKLSGSDGSQVELSPGVAVEKNDSGTYSAPFDSMTLRQLRLAKADVGVVFQAPTFFRAPESDALPLLLEDEVPLASGAVLVGGPYAWPIESKPLSETEHLFTFWDPCARVKAPLAPAKLAPRSARTATGKGAPVTAGAYTVREGAPLFWPDGSKAGTVAQSDPAHFRAESTGSKKRRCFERALFWGDLSSTGSDVGSFDDKAAEPRWTRLHLCARAQDSEP